MYNVELGKHQIDVQHESPWCLCAGFQSSEWNENHAFRKLWIYRGLTETSQKKNFMVKKPENGVLNQLELLLIHILSTFWSFYPQMLLAWVFPSNFVLHTPKDLSEKWCFDGFKQYSLVKSKESGDCQIQKQVERTLIMYAVVHALGHRDNMAWLIPVSLETPRSRHLVYS